MATPLYKDNRHSQSAALDCTWLSNSLTEGLQGFWRFEESGYTGAAGEVLDHSGNGNHGTAKNGATTTANGFISRGLLLTEAGQEYVDCGNDTSIFPSEWTVSVWAKLTATTGTWPMVAWHNVNEYPGIRINNNTPAGFYAIIHMGNNYFRWFDNTSNYVDGNWHCLTFTYPGDITSSSMCVDGVVQTVKTTTSSGSEATKNSYWVGRVQAFYSDQTMGEMALWNRILSTEEMTELYNAGLGRAIR